MATERPKRDALAAIGTNRARVATADADLERAVATAIHRGATWAEIADAVAAHNRVHNLSDLADLLASARADGLGVTRQSRSRALPAAPLRPGHRRGVARAPLAL